MTILKEKIVIGIPLKNGIKTLRRTLQSILEQKDVKRDLYILIVDDCSCDDWKNNVSDLLNNKCIIIIRIKLGKTYLVRNFIHDYSRNRIDNVSFIGRLDADDRLSDDFVISRIESIIDRENPDIIFLGNKLSQQGLVIDRINYANKNLLNSDFLIWKLHQMCHGIPEGELPSCNTFIKPTVLIDYPPVESAEDHWFTVELLLNTNKYNIYIDDNVIYSIYSLNGNQTSINKSNSNYLNSRRELFQYAEKRLSTENIDTKRLIKAEQLLKNCIHKNCSFLGMGNEGIVFHDSEFVYKLFFPVNPRETNKNRLKYLRLNSSDFGKSKHLFAIEEINLIDNIPILKYKYAKSEPLTYINEKELYSFLSDCWCNKWIFQNIKKENFIRSNEILKFIDLELSEYSDNLFLNMCVRAFIMLKFFDQNNSYLSKLYRSSINQLDLPELDGIQEFVNNVFAYIIYKESYSIINEYNHFKNENKDTDSNIVPFSKIKNLENLFFNKLRKGYFLNSIEISKIKLNCKNYFEPEFVKLHYTRIKTPFKSVSLIIKTCPQDSLTIYQNVKHIVKQLCSPDKFIEKIVSIDTRRTDFLRQFTDKGDFGKMIGAIEKLISENIIDKYITLDTEVSKSVNERWFNLSVESTHTDSKIPVTSHLFAFEQAKGDYILQMDSDVLICRKDYNHSFLKDMIGEMEKNEKVVSVGFNICQGNGIGFKPYFGFENGGFVPEVRMGLFHKERLLKLRPFPNELSDNNSLKISWHRALLEKQKQTGFISIRGGDSRSFFIHPQNYRKSEPDIWLTILDRVESIVIPECQQNEFDLAGSYYDWTIPTRNEELVIVCTLRDVDYSRFLRMWFSVLSQTFTSWGMIIIDDASTNGLPLLIDNLLSKWKDKVTFVKNRVRRGSLYNHYKAIHYFINNPESIVMTVDGDDAIIGNCVFQKVIDKYRYSAADAVIGRMYRTDKIQAYYRYPANFVNPREKGGNVWQHLRTFKKYLFDSLNIFDLKSGNTDNSESEPFSVKRGLSKTWFEYCSDYAMMVPIIEMSTNPIFLDEFNYLHERSTPNTKKIQELKEKTIAQILNKKKKSKDDVFKTRRAFIPNTKSIEIDITYECNLKCFGCNRSCSQAPTTERMSFVQIRDFVEQSISAQKEWNLINILGGEPTLHPNFFDIIEYIHSQYIVKNYPKTVLQIVSNGFTEKTRSLLDKAKRFEKVIIDYASFKTNPKIDYFTQFNLAPIDDELFKDSDFSKGCWVTSYCGIGLNAKGYYACGVAGSIDRVIGLKKGINALKDITDAKLKTQLNEFCRFCGNYSDYNKNHGGFIPRCEKTPFKKDSRSLFWISVYQDYICKASQGL